MVSLACTALPLSFLAHSYSQSQNLCQISFNVSISVHSSIGPHKAVYELAIVLVNPLNIKKIPKEISLAFLFMPGSTRSSVRTLPSGNKCCHESVYLTLINMPQSLHTRNNLVSLVPNRRPN